MGRHSIATSWPRLVTQMRSDTQRIIQLEKLLSHSFTKSYLSALPVIRIWIILIHSGAISLSEYLVPTNRG